MHFVDEVGCPVYEMDRSYIKSMPPEPKPGKNWTHVQISLDILAILQIAEVDSSITMQIEMKLSW